MFQIHHILFQHLAGSPVIRLLRERFDVDAVKNRMALPSAQGLATDLSASPHTGGHLGTYYHGFRDYLDEVEKSPRYAAALAGDTRELDEVASDLNALVSAAKYALANGHLFANTPTGMRPEDANASNKQWFENWRNYAVDNQTHIQQMQETVDQYLTAGALDAALHFPLLSPTSGLSMAERIDILKRLPAGSPISLQFTPIGPVPGLPGLVPPFVNIRLPGFIPPSLVGTDRPEGFMPSNPSLTHGVPGFPAPTSDWQRLMEVPPSIAAPREPQVLQFHSETGQPMIYLSDGSPLLGPQPPPDQGSAAVMGAGVLGVGALMTPGLQGLGARLLAGATVAALTEPALATNLSTDNNVADGNVFSKGTAPYNPFDFKHPADDQKRGQADSLENRFGRWTDPLSGRVSAQPSNAPDVPPPSAAGSVAPEDARRLARANESNAGSVFTSGTAPVPYLPSAEFEERFGNWTTPTAGGRQSLSGKPIGTFADEPSYRIPPPIFGVDGSGNPHNEAEEWFSRWIRPLLGPE